MRLPSSTQYLKAQEAKPFYSNDKINPKMGLFLSGHISQGSLSQETRLGMATVDSKSAGAGEGMAQWITTNSLDTGDGLVDGDFEIGTGFDIDHD